MKTTVSSAAYWTPGRAKERIGSKPWDMGTGGDLELLLLAPLEEGGLSLMDIYLDDPTTGVEQATQLIIAASADTGRLWAHYEANRLACDAIRSCLLEAALASKNTPPPVRFFLEPVLADAFSKTAVTGLTFSDLGKIPLAPVAIHLPPDSLVLQASTDTTKPVYCTYTDLFIVRNVVHNQEHFIEVVVRAEAFSDEQKYGPHLYGLFWLPVPDKSLDALLAGDTKPILTVYDSRDESENIHRPGRHTFRYMRILVNTLLYWNSQDPNILEQINPDYHSTFQRTQQGPKRARRKAQKKLQGTKERKYYQLGVHLEVLQRRRMKKAASDTTRATPTGRGGWLQSIHWRGNYWRNQPYGPGREKTKLIYIDPHLAGSGPAKEKGIKAKS